jgi:hypothetical protein
MGVPISKIVFRIIESLILIFIINGIKVTSFMIHDNTIDSIFTIDNLLLFLIFFLIFFSSDLRSSSQKSYE